MEGMGRKTAVCITETGFEAKQNLIHLVIGESSEIFYTAGLLKLELPQYLAYVLGQKGYQAVFYKDGQRTEMDSQKRTALVIPFRRWESFANCVFANGGLEMKQLCQAYEERRLILVFVAEPGMTAEDVELAGELSGMLSVWKPEQLPVQQERRKWRQFLFGEGAQPETTQVEERNVRRSYISQEESVLAWNLCTLAEYLRNGFVPKQAEQLKQLLIKAEELYRSSIWKRRFLHCGPEQTETLELLERLQSAGINGLSQQEQIRVERLEDYDIRSRRIEQLKQEIQQLQEELRKGYHRAE